MPQRLELPHIPPFLPHFLILTSSFFGHISFFAFSTHFLIPLFISEADFLITPPRPRLRLRAQHTVHPQQKCFDDYKLLGVGLEGFVGHKTHGVIIFVWVIIQQCYNDNNNNIRAKWDPAAEPACCVSDVNFKKCQ